MSSNDVRDAGNHAAQHGRMHVPRSRGAVTGVLLVLLGAWGALIPFIGPGFDFALTPDHTWDWTTARFWYNVLPGVVTVLAGLVLILAKHRVLAVLAGYLGVAAGAWYVVGPALSPLWNDTLGTIGTPVGHESRRALETLGFFYGLGAVIVFLAAQAAGRLSVRSLRDVQAATQPPAAVPEQVQPEQVQPEQVQPEPVRYEPLPSGDLDDGTDEDAQAVPDTETGRIRPRAGGSWGTTTV